MSMSGPGWRRVGNGWSWGGFGTWDALGPQWRFGFGLGLTVITVIMVEGCYLVWEGEVSVVFCGGWSFDFAQDARGWGAAGPSTRLRTGLPGGPHPNLPPAGGRDFWFTSQFVVAGTHPVRPERSRAESKGWGWLGVRYFDFAQDARGWGAAGPSTRLRTGLPGGPHPNLPPAGGRDFWFTSQFIVAGTHPVRPERSRAESKGWGWLGVRYFDFAQGARGWGAAGLPIEDGLPGGPHPNLPPAGGRDFWFTSQ